MAGYQRQDADGNISNGNIIDATDLNDEFNAVESAFNSTDGHAHDGTAGNGARIEVTGPAGEYVFTSDTVRPAAGQTSLDIGASANRFDYGYFNHIDTNGVVFNGGTELTSVDTTITTGSNTAVPTSLAVKNYVDTNITAQDLDITDGTNITAIDLDSESLTFTGSTGISATVSDNTVTFSTTDSEIVHDNLSGFVANEHINHSSVSILPGTGLSGGGNITANRTLNLSHLGLENLSSPGADRIAFWDQSSSSFQWLQTDSNLTISSTTLSTSSSLTNTNSISGGSNFTIGYGSGNSLFIQENSVDKVEINKNLLEFKETTGTVAIETQGANLRIGDTSTNDDVSIYGFKTAINYNSTPMQFITVGTMSFTSGGTGDFSFRSGSAPSSQEIEFLLGATTHTIDSSQQLLIKSEDFVRFESQDYVGAPDAYKLAIFNDQAPLTRTTEVSIDFNFRTTGTGAQDNVTYARLFTQPTTTTNGSEDGLVKLVAMMDGVEEDVLYFEPSDGSVRIGDDTGSIYLNANGSGDIVKIDSPKTIFGPSNTTSPSMTSGGILRNSYIQVDGTDELHLTSSGSTNDATVIVSHSNYESNSKRINLELRNTDRDPEAGSGEGQIGKVSFTQETADNTDQNGPWHEFASMRGYSTDLATAAGRDGYIDLNVYAGGSSKTIFKSDGSTGETHVLSPYSGSTGKIYFGNDTTPETLSIDFAEDLFLGSNAGTSINSLPTNSSLAIRTGKAANGLPGLGDLYLEAGGNGGKLFFLSGDGASFYDSTFSSTNKYLTLEKYGTSAKFTAHTGSFYIGVVGTYARDFVFDAGAVAFRPGLSSVDYDLGTSTYKWDDIYATNGTIQTSDATLKQDVVAISEAETRVAQALKGLLRKYRWISSVEEKGDAARYHFGIMAQDVKQAFEDEGLDPFEYAMLTKTVEWVVEETEGEPEVYSTQADAPEGAVEKTTWGVRYTELLAFIIAGL